MSTSDRVYGTVCSTQQYEQSLLTDHPTSCLTYSQTIGLALTAEASFLSLAAVILIFVLVGRNVLHSRRALPNGGWKLPHVPAYIMLSLFVYDILQTMGGILDVRWAHNGAATVGPYYTAQGIVQQIGQLWVALINLIFTVHTFVVALWNYWCWIGPDYRLERLAGEYVWMWTALFASLIMYIPFYFWTKGRLSTDPEKYNKFRFGKPDRGYPLRRAALGMILYPVMYFLMVLPLSITRWSLFNHKKARSTSFYS